MANFKVGDKFRLISGGGEFPLNGAENGEIYTVISDLDHHHGGYTYKTYKFYYNDNENTAYARPEQMELVSQKPTKNQRISALESEVEKLKAELEALKKAQIKAPTQSEQIAKALSAALTKVNESKPKLTPNQQASANSLRKAIIAEAKAFVAKYTTPNSRYDDTSVVVRNTRCTYDFYVNEKKRVVTVLFRSVTRRSVIVKAIAKCAPDDVFNTDIGKAIALGRALGLNVERFEQAVKPTEVVVGHVVTTKDIAGVSHTQQVTHFERHYNTKCAMFADGRGVSTEKFTDSASLPIIVDDTEAKY